MIFVVLFCLFFGARSHWVALTGFKLMIFLPQLTGGWHYKHIPMHSGDEMILYRKIQKVVVNVINEGL